MPSTPRAQRSPLKAKEAKSPRLPANKSRKGKARGKAHGEKEDENADEEQRESADMTMVGVEDTDGAEKVKEKKNVKGKAVEREGKKWDWVSLLDAKTSDHPAVFTKDSRFFFLPSGTSVNIHSAATGDVVSTLTLPTPTPGKASKHRITSLALNPSNAFQLLVSHLDGSIRVWDFLDGVLLRTVELESGITHMCVSEKLKNQVLVAVNEVGKKKGDSDAPAKPQYVLYRVSLTTQAKTYIGKLPPASHLALSQSAQHLVASSGSTCYVFTVPAEGKASVMKCLSTDRITSLAFHPEEEWFAAGDEIGTIKFWYCSESATGNTAKGQERASLPNASHLWHAHAVRSLSFTPNGAYLLSGGEEAVIVAWQLHSGRKEFVPRVGGPIRWLCVKNPVQGGEEEWVAGLADRTLVWVNAGNLKVSRSVARVKLDISATSSEVPPALPLAVHPATGNLLLPSSHPSFLQIYSHPTRSLLSELEVHPSNRVSKRNPDAPSLPAARVERVCVSPQGKWLATLDVRRGGEGEGIVSRLKVWRWDARRGAWALNTRVESPYGVGEVTGLAWMPDPQGSSSKTELGCLLATSGKDGLVKTWRTRVERGEEGEEEISWVNRSAFSYRAHVPHCCAFSPDGSLLAIGQGPCVTLWDPVTNVMQRVLAGQGAAIVEQVEFVSSEGRWLAVLEQRVEGVEGKRKVRRAVLVLWDLLSCKTSWEYDLGVTSAQIVPQPNSPTFVVFSTSQAQDTTTDRSTRAILFNTASSRPFRIRKLSFKLQTAVSYPLPSAIPGEPQYSFVGITKGMDVVLFGDSISDSDKLANTAQKLDPSAPAPRSLFQDYFGFSAPIEPARPLDRSAVALEAALKKYDDSLFEAPAYTLPAISSLFQPFMDSLLKRRSPEEQQPETVENAPAEVAVPEPERRRPDAPPRVVDQKEFETFVEFFKELSHTTRVQSPSTPATNGHGRLTRSKATNGVTPTSTRRTTVKVVEDISMDVDLPTQPEVEATPVPASANPRKRGRQPSE